jgi:gamma-glutamyltranspeptidase/glutathione hydrolase
MIEMMRLGFADARAFVCDEEYFKSKGTNCNTSSSEFLLDKDRISERAKKVFDSENASIQGIPDPTSCTVSFQVVDKDGNAVSFVNSNFMGFGTGLVPDGCGFTLQNRGAGFSLEESHPNVIEPRKRPFHTIIPAMITHADTDELYATLSNMGGFMQPQGHMQLTVALASGLDPQAAIDQPRFCIADGTHNGTVLIEEGLDDMNILALSKRGHNMITNVKGFSKAIFGKAQIIKRDRETGVLWAGSDGRSDGCAVGF